MKKNFKDFQDSEAPWIMQTVDMAARKEKAPVYQALVKLLLVWHEEWQLTCGTFCIKTTWFT